MTEKRKLVFGYIRCNHSTKRNGSSPTLVGCTILAQSKDNLVQMPQGAVFDRSDTREVEMKP